MKKNGIYKIRFIILVLIILGALIFLLPLLLVLINSFKSNQEISKSLLAMPKNPDIINYVNAWKRMDFPRVLGNSAFVTISSVIGIAAVCAPCAYQIVRRNTTTSKIIFFSMLGPIVIPFQVLMIPAVIVAKNLSLINKLYGLVIMYWGFLMPMSMFLYHGFIKSIPKELEEAALIDGCGEFRKFIFIVFPLLKPITTTIIVINALQIFNGFMLPLVMISSRAKHTIPLAISTFFGTYVNEWDLVMAALVLSIIPIVIFFLILQKNIIDGLAAGALKG